MTHDGEGRGDDGSGWSNGYERSGGGNEWMGGWIDGSMAIEVVVTAPFFKMAPQFSKNAHSGKGQ